MSGAGFFAGTTSPAAIVAIQLSASGARLYRSSADTFSGEVVVAEDGKGGAFYAQPIRKSVADDVMRRLSDYLADPDAAERLQEAAAAAKVEERLGKAEQIDDAVRARLSEILGPRFQELLPKTPGPVRPEVIFSLIAYFVDLV